MDFNELLAKRRSVRKYSDKKVPQEVINKLLEDTLSAPSSRNSHSTKLLVVQQAETIEKIALMRDYGSAFLASAPLVILVLGDESATDLWRVNCSISATILQLACVNEGLASCWVHVDGRAQVQAEPQGATAEEYVKELLPIPEGHGVLCAMAIGYSDFEPKPTPDYDKQSKIITL